MDTSIDINKNSEGNELQRQSIDAFNKLPDFLQTIILAVMLSRTFYVWTKIGFIKNGTDLRKLWFPATKVIKPELFERAVSKAGQVNLEEYNSILKRYWAFSLKKRNHLVLINQGA
jgi:hypothetical protein